MSEVAAPDGSGLRRVVGAIGGGAARGFHLLSVTVRVAIASFFVVLVVSLAVQVFSRYVLDSPTVWSEELALGAFVWMSMLALPLAIERDEHVKVDLIAKRMPRSALAGLLVFGWVVSVVVFLAMCWFGWTLLPAANRQVLTGMRTLTGYPVPLSTIYTALPVGGVLSLIFITESAVRKLRLLLAHQVDQEEIFTDKEAFAEAEVVPEKDD